MAAIAARAARSAIARSQQSSAGAVDMNALANRGGMLGMAAKAAREKQGALASGSNVSSRMETIESRLDTLEGGGSQDVTQPSPTVTPAPVTDDGVSSMVNNATPLPTQSVAQDMMGEEFIRNAAVGAAKMIEGKKIN
jgi:hypothetical protein